MKIIVDTREQLPLWEFGVERRKLDVGDYTVVGLENVVHAERKSPGDLYGSILAGHARFKREILRARRSKVVLVVFVECTEKEFYGKKWKGSYRCKIKGHVLAKIIKGIKENHELEFVWCDGREEMKFEMLQFFKNYLK